MQAMGLPRNALQWETERQNRIHQEAIEQKKTQMRHDEAGKNLQPAEKMIREVALSDASPDGAEGVVQERTEALRRIPDMRSALMPFDDDAESASWSKPFSLLKADLEPWLSYYKGYASSRLFLEAPSADNLGAIMRSESSIDYAVHALLELKQANPQIILDPPVLISGPVEYIEFEAELKACRDPLQAATLVKYATEAHENQLRQAVEKGRSLGNLLYDALMGEGHANLIRAWEKAFKRKPNVEELHLMLTTGRIKVSRARPAPVVQPKERPFKEEAVIPAVPRIEPQLPSWRPEMQFNSPQAPTQVVAVGKKEGRFSAAAAMPQQQEKIASPKRKAFLYLHAAIGLAALGAYGMWIFS
ncbi:MAG TPA: hypothetical protein VFF81_07775 [Noviherbaspirillum sp.]|nr:hypothetical protein [Noviherbaspirillum sp.]